MALFVLPVHETRAQEPARLQLSWTAPADCPQRAELLARIAEYAGEPHDVGGEALSADAVVERSADGRYALALRLAGAGVRADRALSATSCDGVTQAAALLIALALDPELAGHKPAELPPQTAPPPGPAATGPQSGSAVDKGIAAPAESIAAPAPSWGLALGALIDVGSLPGPGLGLAAAVEAPIAPVRLALFAALLSPSEGRISGLPTATIDVAAALLALRLSVPLLERGLQLAPYLSGELGELHGRAESIRQPGSATALWLALAAGLQARLALGSHWLAVADTTLVVPHARRRFLVRTDTGAISVHRVAAIAVRFGLGFAYEFQ